ncbi:unnamed protein product [Moneuplotes crassus]|uniref:Uncharacterized protein n=1 Tax=Euplotes crassus TaxID=5936 RepID=A0AAD1XRG3_EUPCR|nr:unnamed protein product [Moneuplotes crassus]
MKGEEERDNEERKMVEEEIVHSESLQKVLVYKSVQSHQFFDPRTYFNLTEKWLRFEVRQFTRSIGNRINSSLVNKIGSLGTCPDYNTLLQYYHQSPSSVSSFEKACSFLSARSKIELFTYNSLKIDKPHSIFRSLFKVLPNIVQTCELCGIKIFEKHMIRIFSSLSQAKILKFYICSMDTVDRDCALKLQSNLNQIWFGHCTWLSQHQKWHIYVLPTILRFLSKVGIAEEIETIQIRVNSNLDKSTVSIHDEVATLKEKHWSGEGKFIVTDEGPNNVIEIG